MGSWRWAKLCGLGCDVLMPIGAWPFRPFGSRWPKGTGPIGQEPGPCSKESFVTVHAPPSCPKDRAATSHEAPSTSPPPPHARSCSSHHLSIRKAASCLVFAAKKSRGSHGRASYLLGRGAPCRPYGETFPEFQTRGPLWKRKGARVARPRVEGRGRGAGV